MSQRNIPRNPCSNDIRQIDTTTIGIQMQDGSWALLDSYDYECLLDRGFFGRLSLHRSGSGIQYVNVNLRGGVKPKVARLILQAGPGDSVGYRNGSRLDLRRRNLFLKSVGGFYRDPLSTAQTLFPDCSVTQAAWLAAGAARLTKKGVPNRCRNAMHAICIHPAMTDLSCQ